MVITIFVRHSADCPHKANENYKRCHCPKHLRWFKGRKQFRRSANARSWAQAEEKRLALMAELTGIEPVVKLRKTMTIRDAVELFMADRKIQGLAESTLRRYGPDLHRFTEFCEHAGVYAVRSLNREVLIGYAGTWEMTYPSTYSRAKARERIRSFLNFCLESGWLDRMPPLTKVKITGLPTLPLTQDEYARVLAALPTMTPKRWDGKNANPLGSEMQQRIRGLIQVMRWTGLAIRDAATLKRTDLLESNGVYRIVTSRQKTGTHVSVPIPPEVARELREVPSSGSEYIFWAGHGSPQTAAQNWANRYIRPLFDAAGIPRHGHMVSHRLRDTFAVDLLQKGVPMEEVSKLLGHTSIKTTEQHYAKWVQSRQDRLDALVIGTWANTE